MQKIIQLFHRYFIFIAITYFGLALWYFHNDYFFGDAISSTSRLATNIYENSNYFYPEGFDPGHPPTYSMFLAWCWIVFGKTLIVSHIYGILWCLFLFFGVRKVSGLLLSERQTNYLSLLVLLHPTFISQNAMMLNTAMLMGCFLWAIYFLMKRQFMKYTLILGLMVISHLQGAFFLASLALADFIINYKALKFVSFLKRRLVVYSIPFLLFSSWLAIHYFHSGWLLVSPDYSDTHQSNSLVQILKGIVYCFWRFLDYGMIVPFGIYLFIKAKQKKFFEYDNIFWATFLLTTIIMSFVLKNTIAHRYFLGLELFFLIIVMKEIYEFETGLNYKFTFILVALVTGNFIYYPGKTIADANIQYRGFFKVFDSVLEASSQYVPYSKAPIANPLWLFDVGKPIQKSEWGDPIHRIGDDPLQDHGCIISSNVCAEFTKTENDTLASWGGKSFESGAVYINIYLNPRVHAKPEEWQLREPGGFEQWMIELKAKFK